MSKKGVVLADPLYSVSAEFLQNPYPALRRLRDEAPLFWSEKGKYWIVSRYAEVNAILRDLHYEKGLKRWRSYNPLLNLIPQVAHQMKFRGKGMLAQDPPDHTRLRSLVNKAFTPTRVNQMRIHIEEIANRLIDEVEKKGGMDLVADYAFVLPVTVICEMLGIPPEDRDRFKGWSHALTEALEPSQGMAKLVRAAGANKQLIDYLVPLVEKRRRDPQDDLISALVLAEEEGSRLTEEELLANIVLLLVAGHETTVNLIGNGAHCLLTHEDQKERLRSNPDLIESAVEEFLRYESPVQLVRRAAACDLSINGQQIHENDALFLLTGSANRDERQFERPDLLDIGRADNKHLGFGAGIHHCLGSSLARVEGQIAIATLLKRLPAIKLTRADLRYKMPFALRGLKELPVVF